MCVLINSNCRSFILVHFKYSNNRNGYNTKIGHKDALLTKNCKNYCCSTVNFQVLLNVKDHSKTMNLCKMLHPYLIMKTRQFESYAVDNEEHLYPQNCCRLLLISLSIQICLESEQKLLWKTLGIYVEKLFTIVLANTQQLLEKVDVAIELVLGCKLSAVLGSGGGLSQVIHCMKATAITVGETAAESTATLGIETAAQAIGQAGAGVGISVVIDLALATRSVYVAKKQKDEGLITNEEFNIKVKKKVCESGCQFVGGTTGSIVGQMLIPVPVLGAFVGGLCGSLIGTGIGKGLNYGIFDRTKESEKGSVSQPSETPAYTCLAEMLENVRRRNPEKITVFIESENTFKEQVFRSLSVNMMTSYVSPDIGCKDDGVKPTKPKMSLFSKIKSKTKDHDASEATGVSSSPIGNMKGHPKSGKRHLSQTFKGLHKMFSSGTEDNQHQQRQDAFLQQHAQLSTLEKPEVGSFHSVNEVHEMQGQEDAGNGVLDINKTAKGQKSIFNLQFLNRQTRIISKEENNIDLLDGIETDTTNWKLEMATNSEKSNANVKENQDKISENKSKTFSATMTSFQKDVFDFKFDHLLRDTTELNTEKIEKKESSFEKLHKSMQLYRRRRKDSEFDGENENIVSEDTQHKFKSNEMLKKGEYSSNSSPSKRRKLLARQAKTESYLSIPQKENRTLLKNERTKMPNGVVSSEEDLHKSAKDTSSTKDFWAEREEFMNNVDFDEECTLKGAFGQGDESASESLQIDGQVPYDASMTPAIQQTKNTPGESRYAFFSNVPIRLDKHPDDSKRKTAKSSKSLFNFSVLKMHFSTKHDKKQDPDDAHIDTTCFCSPTNGREEERSFDNSAEVSEEYANTVDYDELNAESNVGSSCQSSGIQTPELYFDLVTDSNDRTSDEDYSICDSNCNSVDPAEFSRSLSPDHRIPGNGRDSSRDKKVTLSDFTASDREHVAESCLDDETENNSGESKNYWTGSLISIKEGLGNFMDLMRPKSEREILKKSQSEVINSCNSDTEVNSNKSESESDQSKLFSKLEKLLTPTRSKGKRKHDISNTNASSSDNVGTVDDHGTNNFLHRLGKAKSVMEFSKLDKEDTKGMLSFWRSDGKRVNEHAHEKSVNVTVQTEHDNTEDEEPSPFVDVPARPSSFTMKQIEHQQLMPSGLYPEDEERYNPETPTLQVEDKDGHDSPSSSCVKEEEVNENSNTSKTQKTGLWGKLWSKIRENKHPRTDLSVQHDGKKTEIKCSK